jgi:hypothetical protein
MSTRNRFQVWFVVLHDYHAIYPLCPPRKQVGMLVFHNTLLLLGY